MSAATDYRAAGHTVLRGVLDKERLARIQAEIAEQLTRSGVTDVTLTAQGQLQYVPRTDEQAEDFLLAHAAQSEDLEALYHSPSVLSAVADLVQCDEIFVHPLKHLRVVPPEATDLSFPAGEHQDYPELQGSPNQLTMWTPLWEVAPETGSLPVFARQQNSAEARFQPLSDPIAEGLLAKPLVAHDWVSHYEGWSRENLAYYWKDRHPPTVTFDDTWDRWRDIMAVDEARRGNQEAYEALTIAAQFARNEPTRREAKRLLGAM